MFDFNFVEVVLNNHCNLNCKYCFTQNQADMSGRMDAATLANVYKMCYKQQAAKPEINTEDYVSVIYTLKEPMLSFQVIKEALTSLPFDPRDYNIYTCINTNGTLITDEMMQFFTSNNIDIHISIDGPQDIHDAERIYRNESCQDSSWQKVMDLIHKYPGHPLISLMTTISEKNIDRTQEIFTFMSNLPVSCWVYSVNKFDEWAPAAYQKFENEICRFIDAATPDQLSRCKIADTAQRFPDLNVKNGLKVFQDGSLYLTPPINSELLNKQCLGNVNAEYALPDNDGFYRNYCITSSCCVDSCPQAENCKAAKSNNTIEIDEFTCRRLQHFKRMELYFNADGGITDEEYDRVRANTPIMNAVVNLTDRCNLRCPYCFTCQNKRDIDLGTMKRVVELLVSERKRFTDYNGNPCINFFGGEPMLRYDDIIVPLIEWIEETGIRRETDFEFGMTTNGTLLTKERIKWLAQHEVSILLSIDGDKYTQDDQRPTAGQQSSFDMIEPIIPTLLEYFPYTTFRSAIEPRNVNHMFENYLYARRMGFINYFITPNVYADWSQEAINESLGQLSLIAMTFYQDISKGYTPLRWNELEVGIERFFKTKETLPVSFNHCGIGTTTIGVACNGDINGCQEHNTYEKHDIFHIGNIFTGFDRKKHKRLLNEYSQKRHPVCKDQPGRCDTCAFYKDCATNYCPSHNFGRGHQAAENSLVTCAWKDFTYRIGVKLIEMTQEENNEQFYQYLERLLLKNEENMNYQIW